MNIDFPPGGKGGATTAAIFHRRVGHPWNPPPRPAVGTPFLHPHPPDTSSGVGIRVVIKPEYQITSPPPLAPHMTDVPQSTFQFNFDFEKKILSESEMGSQNWGRIVENYPSKPATSSSTASPGDPVVNKYITSGLGREAVSLAILNYGDNPIKVREFVKGYNLLREMGFSSKNVAEAMAMYDNDMDRALAYFLNNSS